MQEAATLICGCVRACNALTLMLHPKCKSCPCPCPCRHCAMQDDDSSQFCMSQLHTCLSYVRDGDLRYGLVPVLHNVRVIMDELPPRQVRTAARCAGRAYGSHSID